MGEEKSELYINSASLERRLQTEKIFFWLKQYFFYNLGSENAWGYCGEQG